MTGAGWIQSPGGRNSKGILDLKATRRTIFERLLAVASRFGRADTLDKYTGEEPPLRAELFSADQMEEHGKNLAGSEARDLLVDPVPLPIASSRGSRTTKTS